MGKVITNLAKEKRNFTVRLVRDFRLPLVRRERQEEREENHMVTWDINSNNKNNNCNNNNYNRHKDMDKYQQASK